MSPEERAAAIMERRGEAIHLAEHSCDYPWCTGTIWHQSHYGSRDTFVTGRSHDVVDALAVGVVVTYDELEDSRPRILLHIGSEIGDVDTDASPTATEARRIAINLLQAADALDQWTEAKR